MEKILIIGIIICSILLVSCTQKLIGGDKDEHGCLVAAGYSWCPSTQQCQKMWETYCEEFKDQYTLDEPTVEEFCGSSTNATCQYDSDCMQTGCTAQVCAGKDEQIITDCMARSCYNAKQHNLECSCLDNKCQWN
jgi:eight-cysteine-cluster-containing protein